MKVILAFTLTVIFIFLSLLHGYWALGGSWAIEKTIPERFKDGFFSKENHGMIVIATFIVAAGLMILAMMVAGYLGKVNLPIGKDLIRIGLIIAMVIFFIRSIGNFKDVGFSKSDKSGEFGYWDTRLYSPLCLFFSVSIALILFL